MAKIITTEELKKELDNKKSFYLIDVLMKNSFEARHIPGAKNVPYGTDFIKQFAEEINASKDAEIIVYCASSGCQLSVMAAVALEKAGYSNVRHYKDGLAGWQNAGYKFEGEAA